MKKRNIGLKLTLCSAMLLTTGVSVEVNTVELEAMQHTSNVSDEKKGNTTATKSNTSGKGNSNKDEQTNTNTGKGNGKNKGDDDSKDENQDVNNDLVETNNDKYQDVSNDLVETNNDKYQDTGNDLVETNNDKYQDTGNDLVETSNDKYQDTDNDLVETSNDKYQEVNNDLLYIEKETCPKLASTGFESIDHGIAHIRDFWKDAGFNPNNWDNGLATRTIITHEEAATGNSSMEVLYPKGNYGSRNTGTQVELLLEPSEEYYASYKIKFGENFSWGSSSKGGKLPGLTGGDKCGSDFICDGTDGFSARYMWRGEGYPEVYLYSADKENEKYGDDIYFMSDGEKFQFETDRWYTITQRVKMNTTETSDDGVVQVWVDGELMVDKDDITYVTDDQLIDTFYFSTFHGGNSASWAPENDSYAYFDDLKISTCADKVDY